MEEGTYSALVYARLAHSARHIVEFPRPIRDVGGRMWHGRSGGGQILLPQLVLFSDGNRRGGRS